VAEPVAGPAAPATVEPQAESAGAESQPAAPGEPAPGAASAPAGVPNQLVLEFAEASFVRVEDQQGRTLRIGLVRGGERHALDGTPPYTVFLGNARNVTVFYAGTPVDFSAHVNAQNDTARFTVP
jgi:cytoskeleton protein RodZ